MRSRSLSFCLGICGTLAAFLLADCRAGQLKPAVASAPTIAYYVAAGGSDAWSGVLSAPTADGRDGPFATLQRARDAIRKLKGAVPLARAVTVFVREGVYELPQTLKLGPEDSGTAEMPIVYQAYQHEKPLLTGGHAINGWQPYRGAILKADVGSQGLKGIYFRQLFFNGKRQILARWPNYDPKNPLTGGWAYVDGKPIPMYLNIEGESRRTFQYKPGDVHDWAHPEDAEAVVFPRYNWWNNIIRVASIDRQKRIITLAQDASYANRPNDRYYFRNLLEELDAPGEWYLDRRTWTLYFWPPSDIAEGRVYAPVLETLLTLKQTAYVTFRGFTFEGADGTAVLLQGCRHCLVAGCTLRNVGSRADGNESAISIQGGHDNGAAGNDISEVGGNAISLDGGNFKTLELAGNYADNNYIHHVGVFYKQGVGVAVWGVGNRVSHNLIHDCPRFGIHWTGNDHLFEYNHIRHCTLETADTGAIYCFQVDWAKRGTIIRYNFLHDIVGFGQEQGKWVYPHMNWGIYLDDATCGTHVYGNIVARTILGGVHVHGGRDNLIENNILVDGRDSQVQYSGYVAGKHPVPMVTATWNKFSGTPIYEKYPGWAQLKQSLGDAWQMAGNKFLRNIICYSNPEAKLYGHYNLPCDKFQSDYNLVWHKDLPLLTGKMGIKAVTGPNLVPNPGFEEGAAGAMPAHWRWQVRPHDSRGAVDDKEHYSGRQSVRVEGRGTARDSSGQTLRPNFVSADIPLVAGESYRLTARVKADRPDTAFTIMAQTSNDKIRFWARATQAKAGAEWKEYEVLFKFPAPGDRDYYAEMKGVRVRFDVEPPAGTLWIDDVALYHATLMNEWEAWQSAGLDQHSIVADPHFVNPSQDDYRLAPDSPALAVGFKPIPTEVIGPYESDCRATWPIHEAEGAREQMKIDWNRRLAK